MRPRRGFTLLEIMVAIALTALIFALLGGVIFGVLSADRHITKKSTATKFASSILAIITKDLQACYVYQLPSAFLAEEGDEPAIHFTTSLDGLPDPETGMWLRTQEISYILKRHPDNGMFRLFRRSQPGVDALPFEGGTAFELYDRIVSFKAEYLDSSLTWHTNWDAPDILPRAVKVRLQLVDDEKLPEDTDPDRIRAYETIVFIPCGTEPAPDEQ